MIAALWILPLAILFCVDGQANAGRIIPNRTTLTTLLGNHGVTEGFESFNIANNDTRFLEVTMLDSQTVALGQGPGLVVQGVSFINLPPGANLRWNGQGIFGQPSKDLVGNGSGLLIDFTQPVTAFGVDLLSFSVGVPGFPAFTATAIIFANNDSTVLDTFSGIDLMRQNATQPAIPVFFGYLDERGIGSVLLKTENSFFPNTPIIDNLTFGVATVPEPTNLSLFGVGVLGLLGYSWRRKRTV